MNILITICARGESKGVPNKNIKILNGTPLVSYTIDTAKKWGKGGKIVCSTDSPEISRIAKERGAEVPFVRPAELATDTVGKMKVIRHALEACEKIYNEKYDVIIDLDVTSPIRTTRDLDKCLDLFQEKKPDALFSVVEARRNPYFNMVELNQSGFAELSKKLGSKILRRQDAPKVFDMNASIYFFEREFLLNPANVSVLSASRAAIYEMDKFSAIDLDDEFGFRFLEFLLEKGVVSL